MVPASDPCMMARSERARDRWLALVLVLATLGLGLAAREFRRYLPPFLGRFAGDTIWALMVFFLWGLVFPRWSRFKVAAAALTFSFAIEFSQLYHAPWIDAIRRIRLGGLILGYGFLWSDLVCYTVGVLVGVWIEAQICRRLRPGSA